MMDQSDVAYLNSVPSEILESAMQGILFAYVLKNDGMEDDLPREMFARDLKAGLVPGSLYEHLFKGDPGRERFMRLCMDYVCCSGAFEVDTAKGLYIRQTLEEDVYNLVNDIDTTDEERSLFLANIKRL
jgi:hypothetical protein